MSAPDDRGCVHHPARSTRAYRPKLAGHLSRWSRVDRLGAQPTVSLTAHAGESPASSPDPRSQRDTYPQRPHASGRLLTGVLAFLLVAGCGSTAAPVSSHPASSADPSGSAGATPASSASTAAGDCPTDFGSAKDSGIDGVPLPESAFVNEENGPPNAITGDHGVPAPRVYAPDGTPPEAELQPAAIGGDRSPAPAGRHGCGHRGRIRDARGFSTLPRGHLHHC